MKKNIIRTMGLALLVIGVLLLAGCGKKAPDNSTIIINDGQFSEMKIIHRMVKQLVETHTDLKVTIKDEMSPVNSYRDILAGGSDLMNSYDGTLLTTYLKLDVSDIPADTTLYEFANKTALERENVYLLDKMGHNNTYAIAVPQKVADAYDLHSISDLEAVAGELVFGAEHEFFSEEGSMKFGPFSAFYNLKFKEARAIDLALKYSAVESGNIDVTVVYATDGMNRKVGLVVLEDDRTFFPEYNDALLVRADLFERTKDTAPNLKEVLNMLGGLFTDEIMTDLTYAVDIEGRTPDDVASSFLKEKGLI